MDDQTQISIFGLDLVVLGPALIILAGTGLILTGLLPGS